MTGGRRVWVIRWIGLALILAAAPGVPANALVVPQELAGLRLAHSQQGAEARAEIERLHGKSIPISDGYVAHYGNQSPAAMLYVSQAQDEKVAQRQVEQMTARIRAGNGPFTHLRESTRFGMTVFSTLGEGQVHYYFRRGAVVVWVAADPTIAQQALADAVSKLR
ncbi:MAG: hypothetical protein HYT85_03180 [candidate division NC10 bacterium]|nr:hypothetical protein [candidate division NC10 bacterium]MBI2562645.1 hypothetical protein [candidate division NC10 bacterium]